MKAESGTYLLIVFNFYLTGMEKVLYRSTNRGLNAAGISGFKAHGHIQGSAVHWARRLTGACSLADQDTEAFEA